MLLRRWAKSWGVGLLGTLSAVVEIPYAASEGGDSLFGLAAHCAAPGWSGPMVDVQRGLVFSLYSLGVTFSSLGFALSCVTGCQTLSQVYAIDSQTFVLHATTVITDNGVQAMGTKDGL